MSTEEITSLLSIFILEEVHRVLIQVLPPVVIPHHRLRVFVFTHHLHLAVTLPDL